jgi:hypothetical protein
MKNLSIIFLSILCFVTHAQGKFLLFPYHAGNIGRVSNIFTDNNKVIFTTFNTNQITENTNFSLIETDANHEIINAQFFDDNIFLPSGKLKEIYQNWDGNYILPGGNYENQISLQIKILNNPQNLIYSDTVRTYVSYFSKLSNGDYLCNVNYEKGITPFKSNNYAKLVRFDKNFNIIKQYNLKPNKSKNFYQYNVAARGEFYYAFHTIWNDAPNSNKPKMGLTKYDTTGNIKWQKNVAYDMIYPKAIGVACLRDSNVAILRSIDTVDNNGGNYHFYLTLFDEKGNVKNDTNLFQNLSLQFNDFIATSDNNLIAIGEIKSKPEKDAKKDAFIVKMTPLGKILWRRKYQALSSDFYEQPLETFDRIIELPNQTLAIGTHWNDTISNEFIHREAAIFLDSLGCFDKNCKNNATMIISSQNILKNGETELENMQLSIYPNPVSKYLTFRLGYIHHYQKGIFHLTDLQGRRIASYPILPDHDEYRFDISTIPNGMYLWQLVLDDNIRQTGKVAVMKE